MALAQAAPAAAPVTLQDGWPFLLLVVLVCVLQVRDRIAARTDTPRSESLGDRVAADLAARWNRL